MARDTPYEKKIEEDYRTMLRLLGAVEAPAGHHWTSGVGDPLRWCGGSIAESTRFSASIVLERQVRDDSDARQLHIEVRLGWDEIGRIGTTTLPRTRRAILWCEMGPRIAFSSTSLLPVRACFFAAPDIEELFEQVREIIASALSVYRERLADRGGTDAERPS